MISYVGLDCPVCHRPFIEEDDIVVCPVCGAPHHRSCYQQTGHCAAESDHGTEHQWTRPQTAEAGEKECPRCKELNPEGGLFCKKCGLPLNQDESQAKPGANRAGVGGTTLNGATVVFIDPMGGVDPEEKIDDIPVTEIASFIGNNSAYYLPRFVSMHKNKSAISVNWSSGIFEGFWMLYRRMIAPFLIFLLITTLINIPSLLCTAEYLAAAMKDMPYYMANAVVNPDFYNPSEIMLMLSQILSWVLFGVRILMVLFGNRIYMAYVLRQVKKIQKKESDAALRGQLLCKQGGIKPAYPMIYIACYFGLVMLLQIVVSVGML